MSVLTLTDDQQAAYNAFMSFITHPEEQVFVLEGFAGTGKSTLVEKLLADLPAIMKTAQLITQKYDDPMDVVLTATTNKACEALAQITGQEVRTIQSVLELRVDRDYRTRESRLVPRNNNFLLENVILGIDEASFIDANLLALIFERTANCKIFFIGDPAQLAPPKQSTTPVFNAGFRTARLTQVVRQAADNQIQDLATAFRETVCGKPWLQFKPNNTEVIRMERQDFEAQLIQEFNRPDWNHSQSKVLAYTNRTVIGYNHGIRDRVQGEPTLQIGDYAICNSYINTKRCTLKTDQLVQITNKRPSIAFGVNGFMVELDNRHEAFLPESLEASKARIKEARDKEHWNTVHEIESSWIDLRAAYACTINKSQGSTYDRVFIDLDDVRTCRQPNNLARLMYVGVSRARHQVFMTGDLV